jgi:glycosyltransferase involved in cell wall biosynthesis
MPSELRVLLVCDDLANKGPAYNAVTLARSLQGEGMKVLTAARAGGEREASFTVSRLPLLIDPRLGGWLMSRATRRRLNDFSPCIAHAMSLDSVYPARNLARHLDVPVAVTVNRPTDGQLKGPWSDPHIHFIAVSDAVNTGIVKNHQVPRNRVSVIHNGVDLSRYTMPGKASESDPSRHAPVVGTFGSLVPHKGQATFLEAAALVLKKRPDAEFIIMGRGPDLPRLRQRSQELGVMRRVTFTAGSNMATHAPNSDIGKLEAVYLRDFDIFVEPSTQEGLGLSVLQAMAWARPVVASGVGGLYSIVEDGRTGFLVPKENPPAMAEAILKLLSDPQKRIEMGLRGRERIASQFDIRRIAKEHVSLYETLSGTHRAGPSA